jgi:hypothetical protein
MSATVNSNTDAPRSAGAQFIDSIYHVGLGAGVGALTGYVFGIINPAGGAIFGAVSTLTSIFATAIADQFCMNQTALKVGVVIASFIASIGIGILVTSALGFSLTIPGAIGMVLAMVVTKIAASIVIGGATCFSACAAGAGLAARERFCLR